MSKKVRYGVAYEAYGYAPQRFRIVYKPEMMPSSG